MEKRGERKHKKNVKVLLNYLFVIPSCVTLNIIIKKRNKHTHTHSPTHEPRGDPNARQCAFGNGSLSSARCALDTFCALPPSTGKPVPDQSANCGFLTLFPHYRVLDPRKMISITSAPSAFKITEMIQTLKLTFCFNLLLKKRFY